MPRKKSEPDLTNQTTPETSAPEPKPARARNPLKLFAKKVVETVLGVSDAAPAEPAPITTPVAVEASPEPEADAAASKPEGASRRGRKKPEPVAEVQSERDGPLRDPETDLPIPMWRPKQAAPPASSANSDSEEKDSTPSEEPRGRRPRGRRDGRTRKEAATVEVAAEAVAVVPEPEPALPVVPAKPLIPIPDDAPQIVVRHGIPCLVRDHRVYPPIVFFGSSADEKRAATVFEELRMAGEAGVHLHSHLIDFEVDLAAVDASVSFAGYLLKKSIELDPETQVLFRLVFKPAKGWDQRYPNAKYQTQDGALADPSICDDAFWGDARTCMEVFVRKLRMLGLSQHILGLHLDRGEWFYSADWGYDNSNAAKHAFRDWARTRYFNDEVALRASWFDGGARFDQLQIPSFQPEGSDGEKFVRSSRKQRRYVDYHLFLSDATVARIQDLAYAAKEASEGYFLVGVSYGYTFEWSHPSSGHLSLGKLLRTPEIDFIAGPPSYRTREPGGASPFPGPIDSFALNGKLFISEEDYKTAIGAGRDPDDFNPVIKTPQALENVHWRGAGAALSHGSGVEWMDLWGNGWLKTSTIWDRAANVRESLIRRMGAELTDPDVVVFIDERALAYLVDPNAFQLLVQNVRESVLRSGLSAGFYLLSDLAHRERFPEAKLYLFLNAWDIRPELRSAIKNRLQRDNKVLFWLYSAGLFDSGRDSLERAREVTGIALKPQPFYSKSGTTILNRKHPLCEAFADKGLGGVAKLEPSYFAIPEDATVLGEYSQTGLPSFVIREFKGEGDPKNAWKSVFLGEPMVTPELVRALGQLAGAHVWSFQQDVVHARSPFLTIHCSGAGPRSIALPRKFAAYNMNAKKWEADDATNLKFTAGDGSTHLYLVGLKEELDPILSADPNSLLHIEELPKKTDEARTDLANFDVPIMRLDEWMEGSDADEGAEEWLIQSKIAEEIELEPTEPVHRKRSRRSRRGDRGGSEEVSDARREPSGDVVDTESGISVMFRKRE